MPSTKGATMDTKQYEKLLKITLDKLEQIETEIVIQKYEIEHLKSELARKK